MGVTGFAWFWLLVQDSMFWTFRGIKQFFFSFSWLTIEFNLLRKCSKLFWYSRFKRSDLEASLFSSLLSCEFFLASSVFFNFFLGSSLQSFSLEPSYDSSKLLLFPATVEVSTKLLMPFDLARLKILNMLIPCVISWKSGPMRF